MPSSTQAISVDPNSPATVRVGNPVGPDPHIDADPSRHVTPDLTGLYEGVPKDISLNPSRLLQINQVGQALVAWFCSPPGFVQPREDPPAVGEAVLVAPLDPSLKLPKGWRFFYVEADGPLADVDPTSVLSPSNPWSDDDHRPDNVHVGYLQSTSDGVSLTFTRGLNEDVVVDGMPFALLASARRLSNRAIKAQSTVARRMYRLYQQQYIPSTYFSEFGAAGGAWQTALALFDPSGPFAAAISAYKREHDGFPVSTANLLIAIESMRQSLHFPWDGTDYAPYMQTLLVTVANSSMLTIDGDTKSFADWMAQVGAWEQFDQALAYPAEFEKVAPSRLYSYTFAIDASATLSADWEYGIGGAAAAFSATVTVLTGLRQKDGSIGTWTMPSPSDGPSQFTCHGAFFEGSFGYGDAPGLPKTVTFYSPVALSTRDFDGAVFWLRALEAEAKAKLKISTPIGGLGFSAGSSADSYWMTLFTKSARLDASFDDITAFKWGYKNTLDGTEASLSVDKLKKIAKGDIAPLVKVPTSFKDLVSATLSLGIGRGNMWVSSVKNWNLPGAPKSRDATMVSDAELETAAAFDYKSHTLDRKPNGWSIRFLLELILSTEAAVFSGTPQVTFAGYASPEGRREYNRTLSRDRAQAVRKAVEDAFGQPFDDEASLVTTEGYGEDTSYDGGSTADDPQGTGQTQDPPDGEPARSQWEEQHQDAVGRWPQWRRVDILVRGKFVLRVRTVDGAPTSGSN